MSFHEKKSRIHFFAKKANTENLPSCRNVHGDKDLTKPAKSHAANSSSKKKLFRIKPPDFSQITIQNSLFDRFSRKKASDILVSLNLFKQPVKKPKSPEKPVYYRNANKPKTKEQLVMESLKKNAESEMALRRSSALNTINLIPNAYKNKNDLAVIYDNEYDEQQQIQTSVEKNSTKIFGIDRLVKGRIQKIFGKVKPIINMDFLLQDIKTTKKKRKKRRKYRILTETNEFSEPNTEKSRILKKRMSNFDQKRFASEHEKLILDLYNYKIDEFKEDLIENDLDVTYSKGFEYFGDDQKTNRKYTGFEEDNPIYELSHRLDKEERIFQKASHLIRKLREYDSDDSSPKKGDHKAELYDAKAKLKKNHDYYFSSRKNDKLPPLPLKNPIKNFSMSGGEKTAFSSNISDNLTEIEEKMKFNNISNFIEKSCSEEHKSHRMMIRDLRGKKRGIVGTLRSLTNKLGVLNNEELKIQNNLM